MTNSKVIELALGRIFRMGSRPSEPGDLAEYERCRALILDVADAPGDADWKPNYARDYGKGGL